jgi:hypothetical protein
VNNLEMHLSLEGCPNVGEADALLMAPAHDHRLHNTK